MVNESLDCPEFSKDNFRMAEEFSFWVEGVFQVSENSAFRLTFSLIKSKDQIVPRMGGLKFDH